MTRKPDACVHADGHFAYRVVYDDLGFCGCGYAGSLIAEVVAMLAACPLYEQRWNPAHNFGELGAELLLHVADNAGLIEHGTSISGSWITEKGQRFLSVMAGKPDDWLDGAGYECSECPPEGADL